MATGWTATYVSTGVAYANFGDTTITEGAERFERNWSSNEIALFAFGLSDVSPATFNPAGPFATTEESFEALWDSNESFSFDLGRQEQTNWGAGFLPAESYEVEWSNDSFLFAFADTDLIAAPAGPETFEASWRNNEAFITSFAPSGLVAVAFDGNSPQLFEDFEQVDFNIWDVYMPVDAPTGAYSVTVENLIAQYTAGVDDTSDTISSALVTRVNNLGAHFIAIAFGGVAGFWLSLDTRFISDPSLPIADLLNGGGVIKVDSPNGSVLTLQRVDATTLWTQSGKLFSI